VGVLRGCGGDIFLLGRAAKAPEGTAMISRLFLLLGFASILTFGQDSPVPSDAEIRKILVERIDTFHKGVGIVVGVIEPKGRRIVAYGKLAKDDSRTLDGDTIFEIGSISKVFTSTLLADMVEHGEVSLDDPVAKYLPESVKMPSRNGRQITLHDLSTHTSGLPRLPSNLKPANPANPYADYTVDQLYQFLSGYQLTRDPGGKFEYSNLGGGLLGHVLARRAGTNYEALVEKRICGPLEMKSTRITLSPDLKARLAAGYNGALQPASNWDLPTLAGAGALRSDANDMLRFLAANLGYTKSPLTPAMAAMVKIRRPMDGPASEIGLGWLFTDVEGHQIIWHNGGTGGYRSIIAFDPRTRVGVVVLSNASTPEGVDDIGLHLLSPKAPLMKPPKEHKEISVDPKLLPGYVGRYQLAPNFIITVTQEAGRLFAQATNQPKFEIFPESAHDFFYKVVDAQITFEPEALVLHQNGRDVRGKRIE
jgi:serine-type D-Ala-D-Ala carboxypeptidase/endopeptidase